MDFFELQSRIQGKLLISFEDLQQAMKTSGGNLPPPGRVREVLDKNGIPYFSGPHNRPWTTIDAINYVLNPALKAEYNLNGVGRKVRDIRVP